jgi:hypothetical protein
MTRIHRASTTLVLVALLIPSLSQVAEGQSDSEKTFTISGSTEEPGVMLRGFPSDVVTGPDGRYTVTVRQGWSGTVTATKEGFELTPQQRVYSHVAQDLKDENYSCRLRTFTVSGNVGQAGVMMKGLPGDPVTDENGAYSVTVAYGWCGTVLPMKEGYVVDPPLRRYEPIMKDLVREDYKAAVRMVTISDRITIPVGGMDEPIAGVTITAKPGDTSVVTDASGRYTVQVPWGWTGELVMSKPGLVIEPPSIKYTHVTEDIDHASPRPSAPKASASLPGVVPPDSTEDVLVIPTTKYEPERFSQVAEDMRVMLDILREKLGESRTVSGVLYDYGDFFSDSARAAEALYIQGYAALFMLKVDFPLSAGPAREQPEADENEPADPVWQRARDRLYAPPGMTPWRSRRTGEADARDFDQLKEDLLRSFRHAANIRNIEPNEWIILTVTGQGGMAAPGAYGGMGGGMMMGGGVSGAGGWARGGGYGGGYAGGYGGGGSFGFSSGGAAGGGSMGGVFGTSPSRMARRGAQGPAGPTTALSLQAKKADIDAFAKDQISFEQFQQKVKVFTY